MSNLFSLSGRTALVIGGGGTLGFEIARGLGEAGARVAITSRTDAKIQPRAQELKKAGAEAMGVAMDSNSEAQVAQGLEQIQKAWGPVSILVNAAGGNNPRATVAPGQSFFDLDIAGLEEVVKNNLIAGALVPCKVVGKHMAAHGEPSSIINISSMAAITPLTRVVGYSAAKAAVNNFTQWLAVYMAREIGKAIRVNAIAPGFFIADQNRALMMDGDKLTARGETIIGHTPMGRFGEASELIGAAVWLASDASRFVTGVVVPVDGGFSAFSGV